MKPTGETVEPDRCPSCGSKDMRTIVYGLVDELTPDRRSAASGYRAATGCVSVFIDRGPEPAAPASEVDLSEWSL